MNVTMSFIQELYQDELKRFKTNASKKAFLTRSKKECQEHLNDLIEALRRPSRMLFGEVVRESDVNRVIYEIQLINTLREELDLIKNR